MEDKQPTGCQEHKTFQGDCHWCNVRQEAIARMTTAERELHGFVLKQEMQ